MADIEREGRVVLDDDYHHAHISLGIRPWSDGNRVTVRKDQPTTVDLTDNAVQHHIDGGKLEVVDEETQDGETYSERLEALEHVGPTYAERIQEHYSSWDEFVENVDVEFLTDDIGLAASQAEEALEDLNEEE